MHIVEKFSFLFCSFLFILSRLFQRENKRCQREMPPRCASDKDLYSLRFFFFLFLFLFLFFSPRQSSGMNSLDIRLDVVFENFVTSVVYLSLYFQTRETDSPHLGSVAPIKRDGRTSEDDLIR